MCFGMPTASGAAMSDAFGVGRAVLTTKVCFLGALRLEPFVIFEEAGVHAFVCIRMTVFLIFSRGAWDPR